MRNLKASRTSITLLSVILSTSLLTACGGGDKNYDFNQGVDASASVDPHGPIFDPANGKIPANNDLLFTGSTDGTLNIPNPSSNPLITQINQLDGFSTSNPIIADFGMALDPASVIVGDSVHVYEITKAGAAITGVVRELTNAELIVRILGDDAKSLALIPFPPLKENTSYEVVLTNKIKGTDGNPAQSASAYSLARSSVALTGSDFEALEPLRQHIGNMELIANSQGVLSKDIVLTWSFTTQSITAVLDGVASTATASPLVMVNTTLNTSVFQPAIDYEGLAFSGVADVHLGTLDIPYYLEVPSTENPTAPLNGFWKGAGGTPLTRFNITPTKNSTLTIPVMMTTPNSNSGRVKPSSGWPLVIYQHGITRMRSDMLIYADNLAKAGFAVIAIDLPLHGVPEILGDGSTPNPFHASNTAFPNDIEPSFDVDYQNNETSAPGPDGKVDSSGAHYLNFQSLLTSRDNTRQGVSNLLVLRRSLGSIADIDTSKVSFIAHSLGGIVGVPYLGVETMPTPTALVTTGASISTIVRDSKTYGPIVKGGLAALGVTGADYDRFLVGTQWVVDSSDPVNYAARAVATHPIYMNEIVGNGTTHVADTTVPNSSTEMLAGLLGAQPATEINNAIAVGFGKAKIVRFIQGDHSSVLDPTDDAPAGTTYINVFREIHSQLAEFNSSNGTNVKITDHAIIAK